MTQTVARDVLVAGIGNIFLGDDGFGCQVIDELITPGQPSLPGDVSVVDYGIRGMHLTYDLLAGYQALVIIDALPTARGHPGEITVLAVTADDLAALGDGVDPHGMNPVAVLAALPSLGGTLPPTYVVGTAVVSVEEGIGLSDPVSAAVAPAAQAVRDLLATRPWSAQPAQAGEG